MRTSVTLSVLFLFAALAGAQPPKLKGHVIGESVQRFLEISTVLRFHVDLCRRDPDAIRRQEGDTSSCIDLLNAVARAGEDLIEEDRFNHLLMGPKNLDFIGYVEFSGGKLTILGVNLEGQWNDLYPNLFKKFGKPTTEDSVEMQNGYGARFSLPQATWVRPSYEVNAHEDIIALTQTHFVQVEIVAASRMRELDVETSARRNPLD